MDELEGAYFEPDFDRAKFMRGGRQILGSASPPSWEGLENQDPVEPGVFRGM